MKRRQFITLVGAATVAPFSVRAQQLVPVVGFLYAGSPEPNGKRVAAFRKGLSDKGDASKEYKTLIQKVKQGYSEAILQEQVPPGYHDGIKSYFDNLDKTGKTDKSPDAGDK